MNTLYIPIDKAVSEQELKRGVKTASFLSFERAVRESCLINRQDYNDVKGLRITEQGIEIIWK